MEEVDQIHQFMNKMGENVQVIWGASFDDSLNENVKITLIATGFDVSDIPGMPATAIKPTTEKVIHSWESAKIQEVAKPEVELFENDIDEPKKPDTDKAFEQYYGKASEPETEPDLPTFTLDDFENEDTLKAVENIPAWKRKK